MRKSKQMTKRIYDINGKYMPSDQACISVNDIGLLRAYAVFDFLRTHRGAPLFIDDHIRRFFRSAEIIGIEHNFSFDEVKTRILKLIDINHLDESGIRLLLTGGMTEDGFTPSIGNLYLLWTELTPPPNEGFEEGIKLITHPMKRLIPEAKTTEYISIINLRHKLKEQNAADILYVDHEVGITESSRSNFFMVTKDDQIITPNEKVLAGVTRKYIMEVAEEKGIPVIKRQIHSEELHEAKEAFLSSTTKILMPVTQVDHVNIGNKRAGDVSKLIYRAFEERIEKYMDSLILPNKFQ